MPRRPRIDPLSSALAAPKASARFRDGHILGQGINVHVGLMPARFAGCYNGVDAVDAHVL
jgi:hypothetical protein